ncbi:type III-B CRISPR module-associated protein Cmr5 [uncultured Victivallis sp.]|uniref:type III-B CRISPR module-associated protein Cmr5 n=1 Tax=uncultured Victivallis sp. TaxID=354118 RepID=UPI0025F75B2C|nr:type III-B CRISPR module-associated protein Cmr5 [uncultured Victivallis sp.]
MKNLDQIRAANAIRHQNTVFPGAEGGEVVKKVPTMIRDNGMLAAAAFAAEPKGNGNYKNPGHKKVFDCIIEHLASNGVNLLERAMPLEDFIRFLVGGDSAVLRNITTESMEYLNYLRRFARKKEDEKHGSRE